MKQKTFKKRKEEVKTPLTKEEEDGRKEGRKEKRKIGNPMYLN